MNDARIDDIKPKEFRRLKLGFLGVGWIGRNRMEAILQTGIAEATAICDASQGMADEALKLAPKAVLVPSLGDLLREELDGIVIATPSALHAQQAVAALDAGLAVFCQKPLGRTMKEAKTVVEAARRADRLLSVDLSYRHTAGMRRIRDLINEGQLGQIFAVDLLFHNAYGPDKSWFYEKALSGGGCVIDLGVHLVDLALWTLGFPEVRSIDANLFREGRALARGSSEVEDFAVATLTLSTGTVVRLNCSWRLQAGCDAIIAARFYGTLGGAALRNVKGSFYDLVAEHYIGTRTQMLAEPPDAWGGRAAVDWAMRVANGQTYDHQNEKLLATAAVLDGVYGRTPEGLDQQAPTAWFLKSEPI